MAMTLLTGCGSKPANDAEGEVKTEADSEAKKASEKITVTDMVGREVTIDGIPERVVANNGALRFYCYVADVDKIVGVEQIEKKSSMGRPYAMANPSLAELPIVGQGGASNTDNYEQVISVNPDVIFVIGTDKAKVDTLQDKTGVPVVALTYGDVTIFDEEVYESLKLIGKVMGDEERANEVVEYMKACKNDLNDRTKDIPNDKKSSVYIGAVSHRGAHGIESTRGNYPIFNAVNAKNVADETDTTGVIMIDKEKLIEWNPDKLFIDLGGIQLVQEDYKKNPEYYKSLNAFKNGEVYSQLPYNWYWTNIEIAMSNAYYVGKVLYPEQFEDIVPEEKADEIYKTIVGKELYSDIKEAYYGGFQKITLEDLENIEVEN